MTRPCGPEPWMRPISMPASFASRRASGEEKTRFALCPLARGASFEGFGAGHSANRVFSSPLARRLAKEAGIDIGRVQGSGPHGRVVARDVAKAKEGGGL